MTVQQNMAFGLENVNLATAEIDRRVKDAARILEIEALMARKPSQLSGGQRQRVAIGRAIVKEPKAFLFDEPLSNLDAALRVRTRVELAELHQRMKSTMVYVTHDQTEAMTLADRIVVLNDRKIEQIGTPMEVYSRPASRFVAGLSGSPAMNFIKVNVRSRASLAGDGTKLPLLPRSCRRVHTNSASARRPCASCQRVAMPRARSKSSNAWATAHWSIPAWVTARC